MNRHIIETIGKTRVTVENGKVVKIEEPIRLEFCPIVRARGVKRITPEVIKFGVEGRLKLFGLCTSNRMIEAEVGLVDFGTSEIMTCAIKSGMLDAAVEPCDGAGTVIASRPEVVQGIGAAMSGLAETSPIPEVIKRLESRGCLIVDPENATIDQVAGLETAFDAGYEKVGVTVTNLVDAEGCRMIESDRKKTTILLGVHTSGMSTGEAEEFVRTVDVATACASKWIRREACNALLQAGTGIPVFAFSEMGKEILLNRIRYMKTQVLIKTCKLPELPEERQPRPLF
jgi:putative methanogenesis marker protein 8